MATLFQTRKDILEDFARGIDDKQVKALPDLQTLLATNKAMKEELQLLYLFLDGIDPASIERCLETGLTMRRIFGRGVVSFNWLGYTNVSTTVDMPNVLLRVRQHE